MPSCRRPQNSSQSEYDEAYQDFLHGNLAKCREKTARAYVQFLSTSPEWACKFRTLEAKAFLEQGLFPDVLKLLEPSPVQCSQPESSVSILTLVGIAKLRLHELPDAEHSFDEAQKLCDSSEVSSCGDLIQARGLLASERSLPSAEGFYERSLSFARAHQDKYLEATSLLNLGFESLAQGRLDEAIDRSQAAYDRAHSAGAKVLELVAEGNLGWTYYRLGDSENALDLSLKAEKAAAELNDFFDQENELTNLGYIYMDRRQFDRAASAFQDALSLAERIKAKQDIYNALRVLARLALHTSHVDEAVGYAERALQIARESKVHVDELYPRLVQGQIAARRNDRAEAEKTFREVERDPACPVFLKWEAEHSLARLFEDAKRIENADAEYRRALATFEGARESVRRQSSQLSFLTNGWQIYDDYVHFLVERGRADEALRWADYSRARTLAEGLGAKKTVGGPPALHPQELARSGMSTILFYWLGERQSYVWAISPQSTRLIALPPGPEIDAVAKRYRDTLSGPQAVSLLTDGDGQWLYRTLIATAQPLLQSSRVLIIADSNLHNLNFDTLIVSEPKPHYWIEDAAIANASSLRVLAAEHQADSQRRNLLLIGNGIAPNARYPELPQAAAQMQSVAAHFPAAQERVLARERATPQAYLDAHPDQFAYIHFVAHGTASRLSPLDSAIILSKSTAEDDSFKLYARDIVQRPLHAELVTISACYGTGTRAYSGEGLVGLSWAFLRAGAHNVIAALWEASDAPAERLMTRFYDELNQGASPGTALRTAKLSLLRDSKFGNPFYWAPFQLYTQGRPGSVPSAERAASRGARSSQIGSN